MTRIHLAADSYSVIDLAAVLAAAGFAGAWIGVQIVVWLTQGS